MTSIADKGRDSATTASQRLSHTSALGRRLANWIISGLSVVIVAGSSLDFILPDRATRPPTWENLGFLGAWLLIWRSESLIGSQPRMIALLALASLAGLNDFVTMQALSGGFFMLPSAVLITALFFSSRAAFSLAVAYIVALAILSIGLTSGSFGTPQPVPELLRNAENWAHLIFGLTALLIFLIYSIYGYRSHAGELVTELSDRQRQIQSKNQELEATLAKIRRLSQLLPICPSCNHLRAEDGAWEPIEQHLHEQVGTDFTHGLCPDCARTLFPDAVEVSDSIESVR